MLLKKKLLANTAWVVIMCISKAETNKDIPFDYKSIIKKHNIKIMALYFPQFHEVEENNKFWGQGFTEWTMMNRYTGPIKKPHVDIGQYNMLDYHVRKKQAQIAKDYGISAFCYYHYWFNDHKVMYKGIEKILEDGEPNIPFTLCWANEPWTRNWDGLPNDVLIPQDYGTKQDWVNHYNYLSQFFKHPNYIKEDDRPLLYVYRVGHIVQYDALGMFKIWKKLAKQDGFKGLKIIAILGGHEIFENNMIRKIAPYIDGYAEHQPTYSMRNQGHKIEYIQGSQVHVDVLTTYKNILSNPKIGKNYTRGIFYSFDNSPRRINMLSMKYTNLSYKAFEDLLIGTIRNIQATPNKHNNFILLNSWNEWTEQAMVEPNNEDGYEILKIIQKIFK
jgi:hypothetical protein